MSQQDTKDSTQSNQDGQVIESASATTSPDNAHSGNTAYIITVVALAVVIALGMGLSEYGVRADWRISLAISAIKLIVQPLVVWSLAQLLGLPWMETQVVVLLASIATGANVYLMSRQFKTLEGPVASSLVLSTGLAALTTPLVLTLAA